MKKKNVRKEIKRKKRQYCHSTNLDMCVCVPNEKSSLNGESCWAISFFTLSFDWACSFCSVGPAKSIDILKKKKI